MTETPIYYAALRAHNRALITARAAEVFADVTGHPSVRCGVPCDTCGATADQPCRTRTTGRVTDTHKARIERSSK